MSTPKKKLSLQRETIATLQSDELGGVNGGTGPVCSWVSKAIVSYAVSEAAKWVSRQIWPEPAPVCTPENPRGE